MIMIGKQQTLSLSVLLLSLAIQSPAFADGQKGEIQPQIAQKSLPLTAKLRCQLDHVIGCSWKKPYCVDGDSVLKSVSEGRPAFYELDLLNRTGRLRGRDEKGVVVQIDRVGFRPDLDIVNIQGINQGWMPWTLSYQLSSGKGFVTETGPEFTSMYLVSCGTVEPQKE